MGKESQSGQDAIGYLVVSEINRAEADDGSCREENYIESRL